MAQQDYDADENLIKAYNLPLMIKRAVQEMQGLATAMVYDGRVDDNEISLMRSWLDRHTIEARDWPLSDLADIVTNVLADGVVTEQERLDLLNFLSQFSTGPQQPQVVQGIFDSEAQIVFEGQEFLFTGKLQFGARKKAEHAVIERGGSIALSSVTPSLNFLVVGELGSDAWKFSRFGSKIEKAIKLRKDGAAIPVIVQEKQFVQAVIGAAPAAG